MGSEKTPRIALDFDPRTPADRERAQRQLYN